MRFWPRSYIDNTRSNLGNVLLKMGAVEKEEIDRAAALQKEREEGLLGEILIELGLLTAKTLEEALEFQEGFRKGNGAEMMLRMVEKRTKRHHAQLTQLAATMGILLPVIAGSMVGVGYVVFDGDLTVVSAMAGPLQVKELANKEMDYFVGKHVDDLTRAWAGEQGVKRFAPLYEKCLRGETTELLLALDGKRTRLVWAPVKIDGLTLFGVVIGQTVELLEARFRDNEDTNPGYSVAPRSAEA